MKFRRFLSIILAAALMLGVFSVFAYAEESQSVFYGLAVNGERYYYSELTVKRNEAIALEVLDVTVNNEPADQSKVSYKWEKSCPHPLGMPGLAFEEIAGATESVYNIAAYDGTERYRCIVTVEGVGYRGMEFIFKEDTLTVEGQSNKTLVLDGEGSYFINDLQVGDTVTLTANAASTLQNAEITYKWNGGDSYIQPDSQLVENAQINNTTNTLTVTKKVGEQTYFCEVSDGNVTHYVHFFLCSVDTLTDKILANGEVPGTNAGTYIYVTKPNTSVTISIPASSTKGTVQYQWYYDADALDAPVRIDATADTITVNKTPSTDSNPYAWEVYQCFLEDGNERVRYWIMLFCLDPTKPLSEINKIGEATPDIAIKTQDEDLANAVFDGDDLQMLQAGAPLEVTLSAEMKQTVSQEEKSAIDGKLATNSNVGMYLDINLYKGFEWDPSQVTETNKAIEISVDMPENLINTKTDVERKYSVVRVHNGVAETIPCTYNATTKKIDFSTDKFSTYSIVYTDTAVNPPAGNTPGNTEEQNTQQQTNTPVQNTQQATNNANQTQSPATGDNVPVALWLLLMVLSGFGVVTLLAYKKQYR